jgi:hypothetical protein
MSHSANTVTDHRLHPSKELTPRVTEWEIHIGLTGFLYIVGPGPVAMQRAYRESTPPRLAIVQKALILLNQTKREDVDAGVSEILAALAACGWVDEDT